MNIGGDWSDKGYDLQSEDFLTANQGENMIYITGDTHGGIDMRKLIRKEYIQHL